MFSSAWFSAIYLLLFISLIGCVTPRAIKHAKDWRKPPARTPRNLSRMPVHRQLEIPVADAGLNLSAKGAIEDAARILKRATTELKFGMKRTNTTRSVPSEGICAKLAIFSSTWR